MNSESAALYVSMINKRIENIQKGTFLHCTKLVSLHSSGRILKPHGIFSVLDALAEMALTTFRIQVGSACLVTRVEILGDAMKVAGMYSEIQIGWSLEKMQKNKQ
jgi:hypothetical protein